MAYHASNPAARRDWPDPREWTSDPWAPPAGGRAECPDLGGQRHDRNRADGRAERGGYCL